MTHDDQRVVVPTRNALATLYGVADTFAMLTPYVVNIARVVFARAKHHRVASHEVARPLTDDAAFPEVITSGFVWVGGGAELLDLFDDPAVRDAIAWMPALR